MSLPTHASRSPGIYAGQGEVGKSLDLREQSLSAVPAEEVREVTLALAQEAAGIEGELPRAVRLYQACAKPSHKRASCGNHWCSCCVAPASSPS